ncbi:hypothetical protein B7R21_04850 [Subtercola boreus]|uniref:Uncharacterized protein n=2 Tax=Subtercola boreus TaxID=120213 RepID=A0A3E0W2N9_9MICO|nr:hypothetical protein B7R21_04850 [Subtercola boreus]
MARTLRGLVAACFATFVAAFSHVAVGGTAPGIVGLSLGIAFAALACVALAGRSLSVLRISIAVGLSQLVFHLVFSLGGPSATTAVMSGHHGGAVSFVTDPTAAATAAASSAAAGGGSLSMAGDALMQGHSWMWAAHAAAALVTVLALVRGESSVRGLIRSATLRLRMLVALPFVEPRAVGASVAGRIVPEPSHFRDLGVFLGAMRHRGPPAGIPAPA